MAGCQVLSSCLQMTEKKTIKHLNFEINESEITGMSNVDFYDGYFTFNYEHRNTQPAVILLSSLYPTHIHIYITIYIHTHIL